MKKNRAFILVLAILIFSLTAFAFSGCKSGCNKDDPTDQTESPVVEAKVEYTLSGDGSYYIVCGYSGNITAAEIPSYYEGKPVKRIKKDAFKGCKTLTLITIADGVETVDSSAFEGCESLSSVIIGNSVSTIGDHAFSGCVALTRIQIPYNVSSLGGFAFYGCENLSEIVFIKGLLDTVGKLEEIKAQTFYGCLSLRTIILPDSVESIGIYAFSGCNALKSVVIGSGMKRINEGAFAGCDKLENVYYNGHKGNWDLIVVSDKNNEKLSEETLYFYSEEEPTSEGNFWHYKNGSISVWEI